MSPMGSLGHKSIARPLWITEIQTNCLVTSPQKHSCIHMTCIHCICWESHNLQRKIPQSSLPRLCLFRNLRKSNGLRNSTGKNSVGSVREDRAWFLLKNTLPWINALYICKNMKVFIWLLVWNHHLEREMIQQVIKSQIISSREVNFWST